MNKMHARSLRKIPLSDLRISPVAKKYVLQVLDANRLSYGPFAQKFEREFSRAVGRKFAILSNSGTSGLQVGLHALKEVDRWNDRDEVLVPAVTFVASVNVILHNNLRPVFVDVEPDYYCIDPQKIEAAITPRTRAIMPVHLFGQSADMLPITQIAKKHGLRVIEDSCETMFVKYHDRPVGAFGDVAVYSTYIAHIIVTGVGGVVTTNDEVLATTIKSLMFHGRDSIYLTIDDDDDVANSLRVNSLIERRFQFHHIGYSFRVTEMEAALGVAELERKQQIIKGRQRVGRALTKSLSRFNTFFSLPKIRPGGEHIYMLFPIVIRDERINKEDLLLYLEQRGIETRLFMPLLSQPIYKRLFGEIEDNFPVAKRLVEKGFLIGSHPYLTHIDVAYVKNVLADYLNNRGFLRK